MTGEKEQGKAERGWESDLTDSMFTFFFTLPLSLFVGLFKPSTGLILQEGFFVTAQASLESSLINYLNLPIHKQLVV